jgi:hypothetical protein
VVSEAASTLLIVRYWFIATTFELFSPRTYLLPARSVLAFGLIPVQDTLRWCGTCSFVIEHGSNVYVSALFWR